MVLAALAQVSASAAMPARPSRRPRADGRSGRAARRRRRPILRDRINAAWRAASTAASGSPCARSTTAGRPAGTPTSSIPQQSVSKFWVSITALDAVDRGRVRLDDQVTLTRSDLTLFHQPIAAQILGGGYTTTLGDLMFKAITTSDNTANDKLMRSIGGPAAVRAMIAAQGPRRDPLLQRRARAAEQDRRPDLDARAIRSATPSTRRATRCR